MFLGCVVLLRRNTPPESTRKSTSAVEELFKDVSNNETDPDQTHDDEKCL